MPVGGPAGEAESVGRLPGGHPGEVPELDHGRRLRLLGFQPAEGLVQGEEVVDPAVVADGDDLIQVDPGAAPAVTAPALPPGGLDEDSTHGLGGRGEEVPAAVPVLGLSAADQPKVGLVDEGGGLEGLAGLLGGQAGGGKGTSSS